jgi:hypothetical protein
MNLNLKCFLINSKIINLDFVKSCYSANDDTALTGKESCHDSSCCYVRLDLVWLCYIKSTNF